MVSTAISRIDGVSTSVAVKAPIHAVATTNITLSGLQTVGGVTLDGSTLYRVLLTGQTDTTQNGIYDASTGSWTRSSDFDGEGDVVTGTIIVAPVSSTVYYYRVTSANPVTPGTSAITFSTQTGLDTLVSDLANGVANIVGSTALKYIQTTAEAAAGVTPVNLYIPSHTACGFVIVERYGTNTTPGTTDMSTAFTNADTIANATGCTLVANGAAYKWSTGIVKKPRGNWIMGGRRGTIIYYYGSGIALDLLGSNTSDDASRIICTMSDFQLDGTNSTGSAQAVRIGWNQRAEPLLRNVRIYNFPHYGLSFVDQNWNVSFENIELNLCGNAVNNSSGIYKDPAVDVGTWNAITFNGGMVEFCGNASSTAGGANIQTTTANRGLYFNDFMFEDNHGTAEINITNNSDVQFNNLYMERDDIAGQSYGVTLSGVNGGFRGGYIRAVGANGLVGIRPTASSRIQIDACEVTNWATAGVQAFSSTICTGRNPNTTYSSGDTGAQWLGIYAPRVSAHKNGTNQTGIATATFTKVTFGTERYDVTNAYASSTFTPQTVGTYDVDAQVVWTAAADQDLLIIAIYVNGSAYKQSYTAASGTGSQVVAIRAQVDIASTTDTIEIYVRQTSGSNKDISGSVSDTWFMASLIGKTT